MGKVFAKLQEAVNRLEVLSKARESKTKSPVSQTISLMLSYIKQGKSGKNSEINTYRFPKNEETLAAIEAINRMRIELLRLRMGDQEDRNAAATLLEKINACNSEFCELPESRHQEYHYPPSTTQWNNHQITTQAPVHLSNQIEELFLLKAIVLCEKFGILSVQESRDAVKQSPITALTTAPETCTLSQTFKLFPGQTIVVKGQSTLDPTTQTIRSLVPETFSISVSQDAELTGFPDPLQRCGWTLGGTLIPQYLQRKDLLPEVAELLKRQRDVVKQLLPNSELMRHAKKILKGKKEAFHGHCQELIALHKELVDAMLAACNRPDLTPVTESFFSQVSQHPKPYDFITETYRLIRDLFIAQPQQKLLGAIIAGKLINESAGRDVLCEKFLVEMVSEALKRADEVLANSNSVEEAIQWKFIKGLGTFLGPAASSITMQYLSEDLVYTPKTLSPFEMKLQSICFSHLEDYMDELCSEKTANYFEAMKEQTISDILSFKSNGNHTISEALASYFSKRYESLIQLEL